MEKARDLMTKKVITVYSDILLTDAVDILRHKGFTGLPVVNINGELVGILTEYDLMVIGSSIHIPTLLKLVKDLDLYKKDKGLIKDDLRRIFKMKVEEVMNREPLVLSEDTSIEEVINTFSQHHKVNPIPIVDKDKRVIGIISRSDMLRMLGSPDFSLHGKDVERDIDRNINKFIDKFDSRFVLVSRTRTHLWFLVSLLFIFVGFAIAWFLILRIV